MLYKSYTMSEHKKRSMEMSTYRVSIRGDVSQHLLMKGVQLRGYGHRLALLREQGRPHLIETPCSTSCWGPLHTFNSLGQVQSLSLCDVLLFEEPIYLRLEGVLIELVVESVLGETVFYLTPEADAQRLQANSCKTFHEIIHRRIGIRTDKDRVMHFKVILR